MNTARIKSLLSNKKFLFAVPLLILLAIFVHSSLAKAEEQTLEYQTTQVEKSTLVVSVTAAGQVASTNSRTVSTNVSGVVKNVFVKNDQEVKSGDKLVEVELDQDAKQSYTQALASYQSAKNSLASAQATQFSLQAAMLSKWDEFKELAESDSYKDTTSANRSLPEFHIPEKEWLAAEAQYKNQQAVVAQAQTSLNSASQSLKLASPIIYAPISGKVNGLSLQDGSVISPQSSSETSSGQDIANIITAATPTVSVNLTEIDVTKVALNDKVTITIDALPNKTFTGKVVSIDTVGAVSSGVTSYPAVIAFDVAAPEVFSNMSAQTSIITDTKDGVLLVPTSAVQTQNGQSSVRVLKDGQPQQVVVETGLSSGSQIEITSGISEGDNVITTTQRTTTTTGTSSNQTRSPFSGISGGGFGGGGGATMRIAR